MVERELYFNQILDLGTGSAILALAAALLLPKAQIRAIDNDPETLFAAQTNVVLNGFQNRLNPEIGSLDMIEGEFDLIMANLTRNTLTELSKDLAAHSRIPGRLILSGLLADQASAIIKTFGTLGFLTEKHLGQDEWSALSLVRGLEITTRPERELLSPSPQDQQADPDLSSE
jgi:ribosomal protein L11 methyltransferase